MYYVYIIRCYDHSLYTGYTTNVERRFLQHTQGTGAKYTRSHPPKEIVYYRKFQTKSEACKEEARIKKLSKQQKEMLILDFKNE